MEGRREGGKEEEKKTEKVMVEESVHTLRVTFALLLLCINVHGRTLLSLLSLLLQ